MDFKYANAKFSIKKYENLPPKHMQSYSYANGLYTCKAEDGTVWVSDDTYTWRKTNDSQTNSDGR